MIERMVYENVPSTGYVGDPIAKLGDRNTIGGPDREAFVFAEDVDADNSTYYDAPLMDGAPGDIANDKAGQLALMPVTHLDAEGKDRYVIEITDPDSAVDISTYRITIMVMDVNDPPTGSVGAEGPAAGAEHRPVLRRGCHHIQGWWRRTPPPVWTIGDAVDGNGHGPRRPGNPGHTSLAAQTWHRSHRLGNWPTYD